MRRSVRLFLILSIVFFPICGYTQLQQGRFFFYEHIVGMNIGETVEIHLIIRSHGPAGVAPTRTAGDLLLNYELSKGDNPFVGPVLVQVPLKEVGTFNIKHRKDVATGLDCLDVNDQLLCPINVEEGRLAERIIVKASTQGVTAEGEEFVLPASTVFSIREVIVGTDRETRSSQEERVGLGNICHSGI